MTDAKTSYHHGDLRSALIGAAEDVLGETGVEAFSLRAVAKRAGVSHAAPAHHFGDAAGLMTALASKGFDLFLEAMQARQARSAPDPVSQLVGAGLGYIDFALARPALFNLMFHSARPELKDDRLTESSSASYQHLVTHVRALGPLTEAEVAEGVVGTWGLVHGLASLANGGRMSLYSTLDPEARDALVSVLIRRQIAPLAGGGTGG